MAHTLIISDGGVSALLAVAAASERRRLSGPAGADQSGTLIYVWCAEGPESPRKASASQVQADLYGLPVIPKHIPIWRGEEPDAGWAYTLRVLLEAALLVRELGGGEILWPITAVAAAGGGPNVDELSRTVNAALLVSQLVSLSGPRPVTQPSEDLPRAVRVRTPYADLTDRQIADLILDMDLPVWTCWFWGEQDSETQDAAAKERERWIGVLREAGWTGSFDAVQPRVVVQSPDKPKVRGATGDLT